MTLQEFFSKHPKVAIAFSGGVDSAYLLSEALKYAKEVGVYFAQTAFQPDFEYEDALLLAEDLGTSLRTVPVDLLQHEEVVSNATERCYHCKKQLFSALLQKAKEDGFSVLCDGRNAGDSVEEKSGAKALEELGILSPLRLAGLSKDQVRGLSYAAGLFTWDKPAYSCLASSVQSLQRIDALSLAKIEAGEDYLRGLGFKDFRVRMVGKVARLEVKAEDLPKLLEHRSDIVKFLLHHFTKVTLDLDCR